MIVVAGGSGMLGTLLVRRLLDQERQVRVLTRDPAGASHLADRRIDVVRADVREAATLLAAVAGAETVVSAIHGFTGAGLSPAIVDSGGNATLIDAAAHVGASVILMSVVDARPNHPLELFRAKYQAEQYLQRSGVPWTIVRATAFVETWAKIIGEPLRANGRTVVFGCGDNPINFVSAVDVAALLARAIDDSTLLGRAVEIGGPANITFNQLAAVLQQIIGRHGVVRHVPRFALHATALTMRYLNPELARLAKAALIMDTMDMTFDSSDSRDRFLEVSTTDVRTALEHYFC